MKIELLFWHGRFDLSTNFFLLWFVRVGDPTAQLTNMYATSPESGASGAVYRLLFISIAFIYCEYKAKSKMAIGAQL